MTTQLTGAIADHIAAVNAFDTDAIMATFAPEAIVNDVRREIAGTAAIRKFIEKEFVGAHVTMHVVDVVQHHGDTIVRARYEGNFDRTGLPADVILTNYFTVRDGKIVLLIIVMLQPSPY
jgi:ketosteroid isomerase-like protein